MRDTADSSELATAGDAHGQTIERIFVKVAGREEIRFSWWTNGKMVIRPLDLPEDELLPLMLETIDKGVFTSTFLDGLRKALAVS